MPVSLSEVREFQDAVNGVASLAQSDMRQVARALDYSDARATRDALLLTMPDLVQDYGRPSALLGADFYDMQSGLRPSPRTAAAVLAAPSVDEQVRSSVRALVGSLFLPQPSFRTFENDLFGAVDRLVKQPSRETPVLSAKRERVSYARILGSSEENCKFCVLLASRGAEYSSDQAAGDRGGRNSFHDNCNCSVIRVVDASDMPTGYDLKSLVAEYERGREEAETNSAKDIINAMRRNATAARN